MAAIANAIERAVGTRLTELPMSPPKVGPRSMCAGRT
jgi:CO/xanthine dehydrogenase Mo-binding subunit